MRNKEKHGSVKMGNPLRHAATKHPFQSLLVSVHFFQNLPSLGLVCVISWPSSGFIPAAIWKASEYKKNITAALLWRENTKISRSLRFQHRQSLEGLSILKEAPKAKECNGLTHESCSSTDWITKITRRRQTNWTLETGSADRFVWEASDNARMPSWLKPGRRRSARDRAECKRQRGRGPVTVPASARSWQTGPWSGGRELTEF